MIKIDARVRLSKRKTYDVGTVTDVINVVIAKAARTRALVRWDSDNCEQFVDVDRLELAPPGARGMPTITDEQIHAMREAARIVGDRVTLVTCDVALNNRINTPAANAGRAALASMLFNKHYTTDDAEGQTYTLAEMIEANPDDDRFAGELAQMTIGDRIEVGGGASAAGWIACVESPTRTTP